MFRIRWIVTAALGAVFLGCSNAPQEHPVSSGGTAGGQDAGLEASGGGVGGCSIASDPQNCGVCGRTCQGAECVDGLCAPTVLHTPPRVNNGISLAVHGGYAYWGNIYDEIQRVPVVGGEAELLYDAAQSVRGLTAVGEELYWAEYHRGDVVSMSVTGGPPTLLSSTGGGPRTLTLIEGEPHLYVGLYDIDQVVRIPSQGGSAEVLSTGELGVSGMTSDATTVVWVNMKAGQVRKLDKATLQVSTIAEGQAEPVDVALQGEHVYWTNWSSQQNGISRVPLAGGSVESVASAIAALGIGSDGVHLYWTAKDSVWRLPLEGGSALLLAISPNQPRPLVVDDAWVYWMGFDDGVLQKVAK